MTLDSIRFGRIYLEDPRDKDFPIKEVVMSDLPDIRKKFWWADGWRGDQGHTPHCVAYSWNHWIEDGPVIPDVVPNRKKPMFDPEKFYKKCQKWDEIPGENYAGTTVRAGAKILKKLGLVEEYRWAQSIEDVILAVTHLGPVIAGTLWTKNMNTPTSASHIIRPTGKSVGGHAYSINGVDSDKELFRIKNSWGPKWGDNGQAYIRFSDFEKLLNREGEACLAFESKLDTVPDLDSV